MGDAIEEFRQILIGKDPQYSGLSLAIPQESEGLPGDLILRALVERQKRLVEDIEIRNPDQGTREIELLALTGRQPLPPAPTSKSSPNTSTLL